MTARRATLEDLDQIVRWGRDFHAYGPWADRVPYDENSIRSSITAMLEGEAAAIFVCEGGMCGGILFPMYFNHDHLVAQELFWWSVPGSKSGTAVRAAWENWARDAGASSILMTCLADNREPGMRRLLRSQGFTPVEVSHFKLIDQPEPVGTQTVFHQEELV